MRSPSADAELMVRVGQGDEAAYEELFRRHYGQLVGFFYRYRGERSYAEDLAQDVFLRLWKYRGGYKPTGSFVGFMLTVARNVWADKAARKRPVAIDDEILDARSRPGATTPQDEASGAESRERVRRALKNLPDGLRAPLVLSRFHGVEYKEIGEILGISPRTVEARVARATDALVREMAGLGALPSGPDAGPVSDGALAWPPERTDEETQP